MSCSSAHQCVTASDNYMLVSDDPTGGASAWQAIDVNPNASLNAVSCPSDGLCVAVDGYGDVLTGRDSGEAGRRGVISLCLRRHLTGAGRRPAVGR